MLDIKRIRHEPEVIRRAGVDKKIEFDLDRLLEVDGRRIEIQQQLEALATRSRQGGEQLALCRNPKSKWYSQALEKGMTANDIADQAKQVQDDLNEAKAQRKGLEEQEKPVLEEFDQLMLLVPQPPSPEVPVGKDDTESVEIRKVGTPREFDFEPKDHVALGTALGILDLERGVKLSGSRNYVLKGDGALLHQAVLRLAFDMMIERGFVPMTVPVLVREEVMYGTGYFPVGREQAYLCERDEKSLVGTAEVPLTALYGDEILAESDLPIKMVAVSPCFRREAGAGGKDTYGLYRVHLFEKVEQVIIGPNDEEQSKKFHQEILLNAEDVMRALELPYRVVNVCTGDLGQGQVQKFDIETWMPSRGSYGETHSASRFHDFQARRLKLRYRDERKKTRFCHTLNNTVIASPRILIPLLELNQNRDGSVSIPPGLRPYMGGRASIEKTRNGL